ncbi:MAG: SIR2 family protein [Nitrospira sp.]
MAVQFNGSLPALKEAFQSGRLSLYLGAGVSKPNGLPSWEELVQALYFTTLHDEDFINNMRPYPNYLFALAEWVLQQKNEPLDIIIRKIKQWYEGKDFITMLSTTLYAGLGRQAFGSDITGLPEYLVNQNSTLKAIVDCCGQSIPQKKGLRSIVTYNYDNLVELGLTHLANRKNFQVIYKGNQQLEADKIPIYHVHGYIPYQAEDVKYEDIIFSEDQYNRAFQDALFWGNVVQVSQLTSSIGLMIGLSLSDRNTRRILDSIRQQPLPLRNYILMRKPQFKTITDPSPELAQIRRKAEEYLSKFPKGRMKMLDKEPRQIQQLLERIYHYEEKEFEKGFATLGLELITFDDYNDDIPDALQQISDKVKAKSDRRSKKSLQRSRRI